MLNREKYAKEIVELAVNNEIIALKDNKPISCQEIKCDDCGRNSKSGCSRRILTEWANSECREPILDEEEKAYLKLVIKNCRDNVRYISKKLDDYWSEEYICISIDGTSEAVSPRFIENTQFKNMERDRKYTLEELDLC